MFDRTYQPGRSCTPVTMPCHHPDCVDPAEYTRGGFPLCFGHWLVAVMWEQPMVEHEEAL